MANYLPRTVTKSELAQYWGVSLKKVWSDILTPELLESWGFDYDCIKKKIILNPHLTLRIYDHFDIVDLNEPVADQLIRLREKKKQARANRLADALK